MHTGSGLKGFWFREPSLGDGARGMLLFDSIIGREAVNKILLIVENLDLDVACRGLEAVIEDGAIGRIARRGFFWRQGRAQEEIVVDADGSGWPIKPWACRFRGMVRLPQRRDVVENPECTAVGCNHEIVSVDGQVVDRNRGKIQLQGLPMIAVVERNVSPEFGAGK